MNTGWHEYNVEGETKDRDRTAEDLAERYAPPESVVATRFRVSVDILPSMPTRVRFWARADSTEIDPIPGDRVDRAVRTVAAFTGAKPQEAED